MALSTIPFSGLGADASNQGVNFRNLIINGDMSIAQRGTSSSGLSSGATFGAVDRFRTYIVSGGTWTMSQDNDVPTGQGFAKSTKLDCTTANTSLSAGSLLQFQTPLEGQNLQMLKKGTSNAESITWSFWVRSAKTGTYICEIRDVDNSRSISKSYTISSANTWEKKTITFDGDTTGTLGNDNGKSFELIWWLVGGTSYTSGTLQTSWGSQTDANRAVGQVNLADSTSNEWYITGVQLEVGTSASDFEFLPVDVNLQRCQRYFESSCAPLQNPSDGVDSVYIIDQAGGSHPIYHHMAFNTSKRAVSTLTFYNGNDGSTGTWRTNANTNVSVNTVIIKVQGFGINSNDLGAEGRSSYGSWEADAEL